MKADNIKLIRFINANDRVFTIPVYQRNYSWKKEQCLALFSDIEKIAKSNGKEHFLGTIVYCDGAASNAEYQQFVIIDGQQRLTSIMLLLRAIIETSTNDTIKEEIYEDCIINKRLEEPFKLKLQPIKNDSQIYNNIINNEIHEVPASILKNNYEYFIKLIKESELTPEEIYKRGIRNLEVVYIQLANENPQVIFESLNSTGLDLTQADLIRNYLLMGEKYEVQEKLYSEYWVKLEELLPDATISDFIRDYLTLKTSLIPNKDSVYKNFKLFYKLEDIENVEVILKEILKYAKFYRWFKYQDCDNTEVNKRLINLDALKSTVTYPFLLKLFEIKYLSKEIEETELCEIMDIIISYIIRRLICNIPTNALNKVFNGLIKDIKKGKDDGSYRDKVAVALLNKKGTSSFPNDEIFKEGFEKKNFYNAKFIAVYVLKNLEQYNNNKEIVEVKDLTIEHIMPQTLTSKWRIDLGDKYEMIHEKYLHNIGNLTLTGYNSELSNKDFRAKKIEFLNSNLYLNRDIATYDEWNEESIANRNQHLFKIASKIWPYPVVNLTHREVEENSNEYELMDDVNLTGKVPFEVSINDKKHNVKTWKGFLIEICKAMIQEDEQLFRSLVGHNDFQKRTRRIINKEGTEMKAPIELLDNLYIESNLNANAILNYCRLIVEKFDGMENTITYKLRN